MDELALMRKAVKKKPRETETAEQAALIHWASLVSCAGGVLSDFITHVPNEGKRGFKAQADFKKLGGSAGYPDLIIDIASGGFHGLRIEMKAPKGFKSAVSAAQEQWIKRLNDQGYKAMVCYGFDEAKEVIEHYLKGGFRDE
jgi:hypothetical protein